MVIKDNANNRGEEGTVLLERTGMVAMMTLSRPGALNALTSAMYEQLRVHLESLRSDDAIHVLIIRGAGKAFASGTDIAEFQGYTSRQGSTYERKVATVIEGLYHFPKPVIAAIHGYAIGAGALIASVCDLRYATPTARFGAPIARTLGNCLSIKNYQHLATAFGVMRAKEMLFTGQLLSAQDALHCGFLTAIIEEERVYAHALEIAQQISNNAPLTIWATKEAHRRLNMTSANTHFEDVITRIYNSRDFAEGVQSYLEKRKPQWQGR
ncbi:MAG: enoyl-CoA hydratase [Chloroflexi bacterium]|nr:MAG: enoyl-CoA hydratase [Chloroflexota bacterium]